MTIKHQDKNISAEINVTQLFDIEVEQNNEEITAVKLTRKNFYNDESKTTYDLMDYFYTEQEIDNFVKIHLVVYDNFNQLPQINGISSGKSNYIYLVPFVDSEGVKEGIYKEYVWVQIKDSAKYRTNEADHNDYVLDGAHYNYESLGSTEIDLSQIRQDITNLQSNKLDKTKVIDNLTTSTYNSSDPTALSAKQGKQLQDNKIDKTSIATDLTTNDDTKVLSAKQGKQLQDNKIDKTSIATDLTTNDDTKVLSAKQGKNLQDNKIDKTSIVTDLTTNDDTKVLSAKQGKQLQDNKVDKSSIVDNVTDANTNPVTSNAVFNTISDVLDQLQSSSLLLNSNQPIIQNGQASRLIARIYGDVTSNDNILFYEKKIGATDVLLDTVSASNGVATYSYSGTGAGKKEFYVKNGTLQSEPYPICDAMFYDKGLSGTGNHNDNWQYTRMSAERTSDGTILTSSEAWAYAYVTSNSTYFNPSFCIEFDVVSYTDSPSIRFGKTGTSIAHGITETGHYKIEWKTDEINVIVNGTPKSHSLSSLVGESVFIYFEHSATTDVLKYANFRIYPM